MGAYTNIKGWIELPEYFGELAYSITRKYITSKIAERFSITLEQAELYNSGWVVQESQINGSLFIFYGAEIRTHAIDFIKSQVEEISKLKDEAEDYCIIPDGFFYLEEDGTHGYPPKQWKISDGMVVEYEKQI